ncbi:cAMP-binding domain of CRP or a regulatory subunit of cAMP-dependent protein kinases [Mucilaginibacter pineti]|uniref:cAMP-binding domain of CRP or a regulatory subunit of cAMP-dependent protein kinases n=1 Tax=Mucilaginibacter pineti TaxID=1391627 RepID=A0A1G7C558_9SPHI|nr:Crp/Fnr family transcriptional regulator [Mucilaginibacter pineti]SDE34514.1 cAMP-binding domain of CRP or a regulatory subunit of cAMP-dependent protein kinases [Mucilaginibacter pineti]
MKKTTQCDVNTCFLCKNCIKEWLPAISANKKNINVKKGQVIFSEGDPVTGIYFVYEGNVKVHKKWGADKELIIRFANKGAIFGHRVLGGQASHYPISATALEAGVVCYVDMEFFESTLKVNSQFMYQLMLFFADELQEAERKMRNLAHMSVKGRVAQALISLKKQYGVNQEGHVDIELTRQDLASYAGATYETVFRVVNELTQEKLITTNGKKINITNEGKLFLLTQDTDL